jgi:hypothetical protein
VEGAAGAFEAWVFAGSGDSRRGIVVRADETSGFVSCYQFVKVYAPD